MQQNGDGEPRGDDPRTIAWRIRNAERAIHELENWQSVMRGEHSMLISAAARAADDMAQIRALSIGTFISVLSGVILYFVLGHK